MPRMRSRSLRRPPVCTALVLDALPLNRTALLGRHCALGTEQPGTPSVSIPGTRTPPLSRDFYAIRTGPTKPERMGHSREKQFVIETLGKALEDPRFRAGALLLTLAPDPGKGDTRIVSAALMKELDLTHALDVVFLVRRLREIADEIEAQMRPKT